MFFSNSVQYAIKSCIYLAKKNAKTDVVEIAKCIESPVSFTSKILQKLVRKKLISSSKGRNGGFYLTDEQYKNLRISDVYFAIEENDAIHQCALGLKECSSEKPCPIHETVKHIREHIDHILTQKICNLKDNGYLKLI